ncbi:MAG: hypothetical protein V2A76_01065 [Planctomycetota bacterium]
MAIEVECSKCGFRLEVADEMAGTEGMCPNCQASVVIPFSSGAEDASADQEEASSIRREAAPLKPRNLPLAVIAACIAAVVGAVAWGAISKATGYEVGYMAWGIGGIVGFAAVKVGGRGADLAVICAGLSLVAILAGKAFAFSWMVSSHLDEAKSDWNQLEYAEVQKDAGDFAQLPGDADDDAIRTFLHDHDYTDTETVDEVSDAEIKMFRAGQMPYLRQFEEEKPSFEAWRDRAYASWRESVEAEVSLLEGVKESIGMLDLLFAFLGVSTAYGLVMSATNRQALVES